MSRHSGLSGIPTHARATAIFVICTIAAVGAVADGEGFIPIHRPSYSALSFQSQIPNPKSQIRNQSPPLQHFLTISITLSWSSFARLLPLGKHRPFSNNPSETTPPTALHPANTGCICMGFRSGRVNPGRGVIGFTPAGAGVKLPVEVRHIDCDATMAEALTTPQVFPSLER